MLAQTSDSMTMKQGVSEQACLRVLRAIAHERIEGRTMSYAAIRRRAMYSPGYTRAVIRALHQRGWIEVHPGKRPGFKDIRLTAQGRSQL
jgi:DNA-binding IscR family transcriptional regulator